MSKDVEELWGGNEALRRVTPPPQSAVGAPELTSRTGSLTPMSLPLGGVDNDEKAVKAIAIADFFHDHHD